MKIMTNIVHPVIAQQIVRPSPQLQFPYALVRNSRGSLPVYSDIRNAGTRYQVQIRNVLGDANVRFFFSFAPSDFPKNLETSELTVHIGLTC